MPSTETSGKIDASPGWYDGDSQTYDGLPGRYDGVLDADRGGRGGGEMEGLDGDCGQGRGDDEGV
jgi:hypothetical protein